MSPRSFAQVLRSSERLRATFDRMGAFALWWRIVLLLHGKPVSDRLPDDERARILAGGFRFYGYLYLGLGALILSGTGAWLLMDASPSPYWVGLAGFGGLYLVASSALAFRGARTFGAGETRGAVLLVTFFLSIIVFLAAFGAFLSLWIHGAGGGRHDPVNVAVFAAFILFGIGSYLIEVLYLVWWKAGRTPDAP